MSNALPLDAVVLVDGYLLRPPDLLSTGDAGLLEDALLVEGPD